MYVKRMTGNSIQFSDGSHLEFSVSDGADGYTDFNRVKNFLLAFGTEPLNFRYNKKDGYLVQYGGTVNFNFSGIAVRRYDPGESQRFLNLIFRDSTYSDEDEPTDRETFLMAYDESYTDGPHKVDCRYFDKDGKEVDSVSFLMEG